jgi:hypothetical protein
VTREEFVQLRKMDGKTISSDIEFVRNSRLVEDVLCFEKVPVENYLDLEVLLNGSYDRRTGETTFNFVVQGVGPVCRVDVNGNEHGDAGRNHKHELQKESCPRRNLPFAEPRPDFADKTPREIWDQLCLQAKIDHTGKFIDP